MTCPTCYGPTVTETVTLATQETAVHYDVETCQACKTSFLPDGRNWSAWHRENAGKIPDGVMTRPVQARTTAEQEAASKAREAEAVKTLEPGDHGLS